MLSVDSVKQSSWAGGVVTGGTDPPPPWKFKSCYMFPHKYWYGTRGPIASRWRIVRSSVKYVHDKKERQNTLSDVCKASYYVCKSFILLAGTFARITNNVDCGSSPIKINYFDYPKRFINRINKYYYFSLKYRYYG